MHYYMFQHKGYYSQWDIITSEEEMLRKFEDMQKFDIDMTLRKVVVQNKKLSYPLNQVCLDYQLSELTGMHFNEDNWKWLDPNHLQNERFPELIVQLHKSDWR